jgi:hypothetical protein
MAKTGLKMKGERIVNFRPDPFFSEEKAKRVTFSPLNSNREMVKNMSPKRCPTW